MKVTVVTISFNQSEFLERTLKSVIEQNYPNIEYIVIDAGSEDGSREIIMRYRSMISKVIFEADSGPAEGLNKGFRQASGEIFGFLNSDDILYPGAIDRAVACFKKNESIDVVSGDCLLIDPYDMPIRKLHSDHFSLIRYAYGANFIAQQSTFFKSSMFKKVGGFNPRNRCAWDGELFVDIALAGGKFTVTREYWSGFRSHADAISSSGKLDQELRLYENKIFKKIIKRDIRQRDRLLRVYFRIVKHLLNPRGVAERIRKGPVYGRLRDT